MIKQDDKSNAQSWELEVTCKNITWLKRVVDVILDYGMFDFDVENVECLSNQDGWDGRYTVLIYGNWFNNLSNLSQDLEKIENEFEESFK